MFNSRYFTVDGGALLRRSGQTSVGFVIFYLLLLLCVPKFFFGYDNQDLEFGRFIFVCLSLLYSIYRVIRMWRYKSIEKSVELIMRSVGEIDVADPVKTRLVSQIDHLLCAYHSIRDKEPKDDSLELAKCLYQAGQEVGLIDVGVSWEKFFRMEMRELSERQEHAQPV